MAEVKKKSRICYDFLHNRCPKGPECEFAHGENELETEHFPLDTHFEKEAENINKEIQELKELTTEAKSKENVQNLSIVLEELEKERKEAMTNVNLKQRELEFYNQLNEEKLNKLLLDKDNAVLYQKSLETNFEKRFNREKILKDKEISLEKEIYELEKNKKRIDVDQIGRKYLKTKENIYRKLKEEDIQKLHESLVENRKKMGVLNTDVDISEDSEKLNIKYYNKYFNILNNQPKIEENRKFLIGSMAECNELVAILSNFPRDLNKPAFWGRDKPNEKIQEKIEKKLKWLEDPNYFDSESVDLKRDITDDVDRYFKSRYDKAALSHKEDIKLDHLKFGDI